MLDPMSVKSVRHAGPTRAARARRSVPRSVRPVKPAGAGHESARFSRRSFGARRSSTSAPSVRNIVCGRCAIPSAYASRSRSLKPGSRGHARTIASRACARPRACTRIRRVTRGRRRDARAGVPMRVRASSHPSAAAAPAPCAMRGAPRDGRRTACDASAAPRAAPRSYRPARTAERAPEALQIGDGQRAAPRARVTVRMHPATVRARA
ncbi:hypothetical protein Y048_476 [Burkholderia pseudomallei MSHR456]|nr:hypothetical protein Y048_476 [Burkholderia pseudomallei MSHR456]